MVVPASGEPPPRGWPLGRKLAVGLAILALPSAGALALSLHDFHALAGRMDRLVLEHATDVIRVSRARRLLGQERSSLHGYLLTRDPRFLDGARRARSECAGALEVIGAHVGSEEARELFEHARDAHDREGAESELLIATRGDAPAIEAIADHLERDVLPERAELDVALDRFAAHEEDLLERERADAIAAATRAVHRLVAIAVVGAIWAFVLALLLARTMRTLRRWQSELSLYVDQVETCNRDLDAFAGRIAHDLRNALAPLGLVPATLRQCVARGGPDAERLERLSGRVERTVARAGGLIDGLLAFSRADLCDIAETPSLAAVLADVREELEPLEQRVGATVDEKIEDVAVGCSPGLLHLVLANLLSNAIKFLDGRPTRRVTVACAKQGPRCEITVEDTGPGIPAGALERIFEPFYRAPGGHVPGSGIGLATVRRVVEAHGGQVTAESSERGAVFRVRLPLPGKGTGRGARRPPGTAPAQPPPAR